MSKSLSAILILLLLSSCAVIHTGTESKKPVSQEQEIPFFMETTEIYVTKRIIEIDEIYGFRIDDINFCEDDVEYEFIAYDKNDRITDRGIYQGIGTVPYLVELKRKSYKVAIWRE